VREGKSTSRDPGELERRGRTVSERTEEAIEQQLRIRDRLILHRTVPTHDIHAIAGADAAYTDQEVIASVAIMNYPSQQLLCTSVSSVRNIFPYIPGLFAFREGQGILSALDNITCAFDAIFLHGHGYAHPRRCGLASHLGVLIDRPSIGVADHLLVGKAEMPGTARGALAPVIDGEEVIGMAVRTRKGSRPVYVSVGHRTDLSQAVELVLMTTEDHRMPEPVRAADRMAREYRRHRTVARKPSH
jgi:deoxyribonuclease V